MSERESMKRVKADRRADVPRFAQASGATAREGKRWLSQWG